MPISSGTRLGPYEILAPLGAGGMGEVYRARDPRLGREVAIKVLPSHLSANPQLRERFGREARAISGLSHPHICTVYDVGHQDGVDFLVMEYIEGETLADRLGKGLLPLEQVVRYGAEIAEALDKAHRQGIVHRDLKPGNVMITKSGAKVLDFGLAKYTAQDSSLIAHHSSLQTAHKPLTQEGTILGTLQYMAPEQLEGAEADARTDLWALGAVLYEMVTGRRAFEGKSKTSLIAAIMDRDPPPISQIQPLAPPALQHLITKCLDKQADDRWQSAHDVAEELRWIREAGSQAGVAVRGGERKRLRLLAWSGVIAVSAAVTAVILTVPRLGSDRQEQATMKFSIPLVSTRQFSEAYGLLTISPDGKSIVYVGSDETGQKLYLRSVSRLDSTPLPGTEGALQPFFSPDGKWIGFFSQHKIMKVPLGGGAPIVLANASIPRGASWGDDGTIVFAPFHYAGLSRLPVGGKAEPLTKLDSKHGERNHRWPDVLPGSRAALFTVGFGSKWDNANIELVRLDTKERRTLIRGGFGAKYIPTGHIVYSRGKDLLAVPFDLKKLEVHGDPFQILEGVADNQSGASEYAFSRKGLLVYLPAGALFDEGGRVVFLNRKGERLPVPIQALADVALRWPQFSPDGLKVVGRAQNEVWLYDLARGSATRLATGSRIRFPIWSADGKRVTYGSERDGPWNPFWRAADGSDEEQRLLKRDTPLLPLDWSRDGTKLLLEESNADTALDISVLSIREGRVEPLLRTPATESGAVFSPDQKWIAYASDESGRFEIYVRPVGATGRWQISTGGGVGPRWKRQDELIYKNGRRFMRVAVRTEPSFRAEKPELLFEGPYREYDIDMKHERFIAVEEERDRTPDQLNVVIGWFEDIRAKSAEVARR